MEVITEVAVVAVVVLVVEVVVVFSQYMYGTIKCKLDTVGKQQVSKHSTTTSIEHIKIQRRT